MKRIISRVKQARHASYWLMPLVIVLLILPQLLPVYGISLVTEVLIYAVFALSYNLLLGYGGLPSLGHAAYFGMGGYAIALLVVKGGFQNFWFCLGVALVAVAIFSLLTTFLVVRSTGVYFLMVTFAVAQMPWAISWSWYSLTRGENGLSGIARPDVGLPGSFAGASNFYYLILVFFALSLFLLYLISQSPYGRALVGIRENEVRMRALGYNTMAYKYFCIVLGGMFGGLAGILKAYYDGVVTPSYFSIMLSGLVLLMVVAGGQGIFAGPILGAAVVWLLRQIIASYTAYWSIALGVLFVIIVLFAPQGIAGYIVRWREGRKGVRLRD